MILGIFSNIGSGKSLFADIMKKKYDFKLIKADELAKNLYIRGTREYKELIKLFSEDILDENLEIDKKKLGDLLFFDTEKLNKVNNLIHNKVWNLIEKEILDSRIKKENLLIEAAILPSIDKKTLYDKIIYIKSDKELIKERLIKNRAYSINKIEEIFKIQEKEEEFLEFSDYIIYNNSDILELENNIKNMMEDFKYENV